MRSSFISLVNKGTTIRIKLLTTTLLFLAYLRSFGELFAIDYLESYNELGRNSTINNTKDASAVWTHTTYSTPLSSPNNTSSTVDRLPDTSHTQPMPVISSNNTRSTVDHLPDTNHTQQMPVTSSNNTASPVDHLPATKHTRGRYSVSLVTSFWANAIHVNNSDDHAQHVHEITTSVLTNINNPHFHQVVIILDSSTQLANCTHFLQTMQDLQQLYINWSTPKDRPSTKIILKKAQQTLSSKLTCVDREQGQPNYYEMFQYATNASFVKGEIVVLANADQAFDDSAQWAGLIERNTVLTLPTHGYAYNKAPTQITNYFKFAHRYSRPETFDWDQVHVTGRCYRGGPSWDGYVFHQDYLRGQLHPEDFMSDTTSWNNRTNSTEHGRAFFKMNEMGAENAALWGATKNLPDVYDANGCFFIRSWHLHDSPKMHAAERRKEFGWAGTDPSRVPFPNCGSHSCQPRRDVEYAFVVKKPKARH